MSEEKPMRPGARGLIETALAVRQAARGACATDLKKSPGVVLVVQMMDDTNAIAAGTSIPDDQIPDRLLKDPSAPHPRP
ncbi:hypothetical protein ACFRMN_37920 [Streptomyces sp. NPDC056835]|uniref:hypothetical protein n=1 Tax=Streptomyces sp. NPDC056835 TaxID=3345956 RepID=UPI00367D694D